MYRLPRFASRFFLVLSMISPCVAAQNAKEGEVVTDVALEVRFGGDGRSRLREFRGETLLFVFFQNIAYGMDAGRRGYDLHQKYGEKGLVTFFIDGEVRDGADGWAKSYAFLLETFKVFNGRLIDYPKLPIEWGGQDEKPPLAALVGCDGRLLAAGSFARIGGKMEKLIAADLDRAKSGWGDDPIVKRARASTYGKQNYKEAYTGIYGKSNQSDQGEIESFQRELSENVEFWVKRIEKVLEAGDISRATAELDAFTAAMGGYGPFDKMAAGVRETLASPEGNAEIEAAKKLAAITKGLVTTGKSDAATSKKLAAFIEEHAAKRVARYAKNWSLVATALASPVAK